MTGQLDVEAKTERAAENVIGFWNIAAADPDRRALVRVDGSEVSYGEICSAANQIAHGLRELGLSRGDSVAVMLPPDAAFYEVYFAIDQIGVYLTPINYNLTGSEVAYILDNCDASVFVVDERFGSSAREAVRELGFRADRCFATGQVDGFRPFAELKSSDSSTPPNRSLGLDMWYTSGTTGRPKGVRKPLPEGEPYEDSKRTADRMGLFGLEANGGPHILTSPIYHGAPEAFSYNSMHLGNSVVLMKKFEPDLFLQLVERYGVTNSHMVPTMFTRLLSLPEEVRTRYDVSSLKAIVHASAPCPVDVKRRMFDWWGPIIYEYYAASEGGGTFVRPDEWLRRPGTVGRALPGADVKIMDEDGNELSPNEPGNVYMKSNAGLFSYHKAAEKTQDTYRGEYFSVGDVGYLDEEGWLFLTDRKASLIISGGVNIYPAEIESELSAHPKVADVAVVGIPDDSRGMGEVTHALVQLRDGVIPTADLEAELNAWCQDRLARYKCPRSWEFRAQIPRSEAGKLDRRGLRDEFWQGRARNI